jgi:hypothetical protein
MFRLNPDSIINGVANPLLAPKVSLCGLHRHVSKQKLNLVEFTASLMTEPGTSSSEMPHAAFEALYRMRNYAESILKMLSWR